MQWVITYLFAGGIGSEVYDGDLTTALAFFRQDTELDDSAVISITQLR